MTQPLERGRMRQREKEREREEFITATHTPHSAVVLSCCCCPGIQALPVRCTLTRGHRGAHAPRIPHPASRIMQPRIPHPASSHFDHLCIVRGFEATCINLQFEYFSQNKPILMWTLQIEQPAKHIN